MADDFEIGSAHVKISLDDLLKLDKKVDSSGRNFVQNFDKMQTRSDKLAQGFGALGGAIATIGIAKLGADIYGASIKFDTMNRMLVNIEGSQAKANKRFNEFRILAKEPVLDPFNLSRFYVGLKSVNVEADLSIRFMKSLANSMAGVGAGNEEFARSMEQVVQMMGKGKLVGQDLRVIAESFPQIRKYISEAFGGITDPEELAKKGYTALDVLTKLNEVMEKQPKFAGGAQAALDNFKQSLVLFEASLGKDVLPSVSKFLDYLTKLMDAFSAMPEATKSIIGKSVVGGLGLLGIAASLSSIISLIGLTKEGLIALGAVKVGANVGAVAGGGGIGSTIGKIGIITLIAAEVYLTGKAIYNAFTRDFTKEEKQGIREAGIKQQELTLSRLKEVQMNAGNFPSMTFGEMSATGATTKDNLEIYFESLGQTFKYWQNKTFADLQKSLALPTTMYNVPAGPEPYKGATGLKSLSLEEFEKQYKAYTDISGEGYKNIDLQIAKINELITTYKLEPATLREANELIKGLNKDRYEDSIKLYKAYNLPYMELDELKGFGLQDMSSFDKESALKYPSEQKRAMRVPYPKVGELFPYPESTQIGNITFYNKSFVATTALFDEQIRKADLLKYHLAEVDKERELSKTAIASISEITNELSRSQDEQQQKLKELGSGYTDMGLSISEVSNAYKFLYEWQDKVTEKVEKAAKKGEADWKDIVELQVGTGRNKRYLDPYLQMQVDEEAQRKRTEKFWKDIGDLAKDTMGNVISKSVDDMFNHFTEKQVTAGSLYNHWIGDMGISWEDWSRNFKKLDDDKYKHAIDAWNDYGYKMGLKFDDFENAWELTHTSMLDGWKGFLTEMLKEWAITIAKMEIGNLGKDLYNYVTGDEDKGNKSLIGKGLGWGVDWLVGKLGKGQGAESTVEQFAGGAEKVYSTGGGGGAAMGAIGKVAFGVAMADASYKIGKGWAEMLGIKDRPEGSGHSEDWTKGYLQEQYHMGKYENRALGVYASPDSYEKACEKLGIEPYPLALGGIVTRPTMAMIGERGREAVIPLDTQRGKQMLSSSGMGGGVTIENINLAINLPNATLDSVDQTQVDRFFNQKLLPSLRRAVQQGALS